MINQLIEILASSTMPSTASFLRWCLTLMMFDFAQLQNYFENSSLIYAVIYLSSSCFAIWTNNLTIFAGSNVQHVQTPESICLMGSNLTLSQLLMRQCPARQKFLAAMYQLRQNWFIRISRWGYTAMPYRRLCKYNHSKVESQRSGSHPSTKDVCTNLETEEMVQM